MELSGVLSSWDILARTSDLARAVRSGSEARSFNSSWALEPRLYLATFG